MSWLKKLLPPKIKRDTPSGRKAIPEGLWSKCPACEAVLYRSDLESNLNVCPKCGHHQRIRARQRIELLLDPEGQFEIGAEVVPIDPLKFKDSKRYPDRLAAAHADSDESDALVVVQGMTYAAPAMVAIANGLTMLLFFITVWVMGCAAIPLLNLAPAVAALRQGIVVCMAVMIAAPIIWLSGGTIMQMTAHAWLTSPLYLASLVCLAVAFVLSRQGERRAKAIFVLLFVGIFLSRLTFFGDTISTIVNIGHLY